MEMWRTAIVDAGPTHLRVRGHDVPTLMREATFTDLIFLLHARNGSVDGANVSASAQALARRLSADMRLRGVTSYC